jgi:RNA polymerase primary sigma factor
MVRRIEGEDPIDVYLRAIGKASETVKEEYDVEDEVYNEINTLLFDKLYTYKPGSREYKEVFNAISCVNLKLMVGIANKHLAWAGIQGLSLDDLMQEGYFGIRRAIEKFDPDKGAQFSTYATWWIKNVIKRAIKEGGVIRKPQCQHDFMLRVERERRKAERGVLVLTYKQLAEKLNLKESYVKERLGLNYSMVSIDTRTHRRENSGDHTTYAKNIKDEDAENPLESLLKRESKERVAKAIRKLRRPRDRDIINMRYGLGKYMGKTYTLRTIGKKHSISWERVRQIEMRTVKKLGIMLNKLQ